MLKIINPGPIFINAWGSLLNGGMIYIGVVDSDPAVMPLSVFYDQEMTEVAAQPLRVIAGRIVNEELSPASVFVDADDYSIRVTDSNNAQVDYWPSAKNENAAFQPLDSDLTAIAMLETTPYGRALLTIADANALKAATGISDCLPLSGGTMASDIRRSGAGVYTYWTAPGMTSGRLFLSTTGGGDPTSLPGDVWMAYDA